VRHHDLNDVIAKFLASSGVPVFKEPSGLCRSDGKRPGGLTLILWRAGQVSNMGCGVVSHDCRLLSGSFISRGRHCGLVGRI